MAKGETSNHMRRLLLLLTVLVLGLAPLLAQAPDTTFTITLNGTLGPIISGSDPLGGNGATATMTAKINESATPRSSTATSATYTLPKGAVSATLSNGISFTSTTAWTMKITLAAKYDTVVFSGAGPLGTTVSATSLLKVNSWTTAVLTHPAPFAPSPQNLTQPHSTLKYTLAGSSTVLGFTGTISN
jgi:hypothetical protein